IRDFSIEQGGSFVGIVVEQGKILTTNGVPTGVLAPPAYRTLASGVLDLPREVASFNFPNARPTRLTTLFGFDLLINNAPQTLDLALVSLTSDTGPTNNLVVL